MDIEIGGKIEGITLSSFLQIVHTDSTSCTLKVICDNVEGYLYFEEGDLVAAETNTINGLDAAYEILSWNTTVIIVDSGTALEKNITTPLMNILMEGLRCRDEKNAQQDSGDDFSPESYVSKDSEIASEFVLDDQPPPFQEDSSLSGMEFELETPPEPPKTKPPVRTEAPPPPPPPPPKPPVAQQRKAPQEPEEYEIEEEPARRVWGSIKRLILIVLILSVGTFGGLYYYKISLMKKDYTAMVERMKTQSDLAGSKRVLNRYINSREDYDKYLPKAVDVMNVLEELIAVDNQVKRMPVNGEYKEKATALYSEFLKHDNNSFFSTFINKKLKAIPEKVETVEFLKLGTLIGEHRVERINAYRKFLSMYPQSKHVQSVKNLIAAVGDEAFFEFKSSIQSCNQAENWDNCMQLAAKFLQDFPGDNRYESVGEFRAEMKEKSDFVKLKNEAATTDFRTAREMYLEYVKRHPETTLKKEIRMIIADLNKKVESKSRWDDAYTYCTNKKIPLKQRIREIKTFIENDYTGRYKDESTKLLADLENEAQVGVKQKKQQLQERKKKERLAEEQANKDKIAKEKESARKKELRRRKLEKHLKEQTRRIASEIGGASSRFQLNKDRTVKDTQSGLMWVVIDSYVATGKCMPFKKAKAYVSRLRLGGYKDWRLPSTGELAVLYNQKPYFPSSGAKWYWTSEVIAYEEKAGIFLPEKKDVFRKVYTKFDKCGYVHAVRP